MKKDRGNRTPNHYRQTKDFQFTNEEAAEIAYEQAVDIINDKFFMEGTLLVSKVGNLVRVPMWFPFSPVN